MSNPYGMNDDENKDYEAFMDNARKNMLPALRQSAIGLSIMPSELGEIDMKLSMELGAMILLDKPIILVIQPGQIVGDHLVRVADEIVEFNSASPDKTHQAIHGAILRIESRMNQ